MVAFEIEPHELTVTPSIGIALFPGDGTDFDTLSRCADAAMYRAKQDGRNNYRFFTAEMQADRNAPCRSKMPCAVRWSAISCSCTTSRKLSLQLAASLAQKPCCAGTTPSWGVPPAEFIPVAESCGLILPIGEWVLRTCRRSTQGLDGSRDGPITIAVNLSSVQFRHADLPELVTTHSG